MRKPADRMLLALFLLSLALYVALIVYGSGTPWKLRLVFTFHAVPAFCLQMLLCRNGRRWVAAIPTLILLGAALFSTFGWFTTTGWDRLGCAIFLGFSAPPTVGCALAWAVFGCWKLCRRGDIRVP